MNDFVVELVKFCSVENDDNSSMSIRVVIEVDESGNYCLPSMRLKSTPLTDAKFLSSKYGVVNSPRVLDISEDEGVKISYFDTSCDLIEFVSREVLFPIHSLPSGLPREQKKIVRAAIDRLSVELQYAETVSTFLPRLFSLPAVRSLYEQVWGRETIDARNFRRRMLGEEPSQGVFVEEANAVLHKGIRGRPPTLYKISSDWKSSSSTIRMAHYPTIRSK
jgi:hypothetical protein